MGWDTETRFCMGCGALGGEGGQKLLLCPCALGVRYCKKDDKSCQRKDWKRHKPDHINNWCVV